MKELALSIYTGADQGNAVTMTAKFESHEEAVEFHEGIARLCKSMQTPRSVAAAAQWPLKLLSGKG